MPDARRVFGDSFLSWFVARKGLTLADARCPTEFYMEEMIYIGDGLYLGDHTKSFGSKDWYRDVGVRDGYVSIGVEGL